jgi:hypothetical protein
MLGIANGLEFRKPSFDLFVILRVRRTAQVGLIKTDGIVRVAELPMALGDVVEEHWIGFVPVGFLEVSERRLELG